MDTTDKSKGHVGKLASTARKNEMIIIVKSPCMLRKFGNDVCNLYSLQSVSLSEILLQSFTFDVFIWFINTRQY